jgi:hypothetical protein
VQYSLENTRTAKKEVRVPDDVVLGINVRGKEKILKIWEN